MIISTHAFANNAEYVDYDDVHEFLHPYFTYDYNENDNYNNSNNENIDNDNNNEKLMWTTRKKNIDKEKH